MSASLQGTTIAEEPTSFSNSWKLFVWVDITMHEGSILSVSI